MKTAQRRLRGAWRAALPLGVVLWAAGGAAAQDAPEAGRSGFMVRHQPQPITDAIEDFERYRDRKAWEKAFAALDKVADAGGDRLVVGPDGLAVSTPAKVRGELLTLPPDGRQAYRLFNDAKARALFDQATAPAADDAPPVDEIGLLHRVVDRYFVTAVGDRAADRLGDALFEAGDFAGAEACWRLILDDYPDSSLPAAGLAAKRAAALAAAGQWGPFGAVRAAVDDRYAGQSVRIGGRDVDAVAYVDGLAAGDPRGAVATTAPAAGPPLAMPATDGPAWQVPLMDAATAKQVESQMVMYGWGQLAGQIVSAVPPAAVDAKRVYVDWFGACLAIDVRTGKLLWRTASPVEVAKTVANGPQQGTSVSPNAFAVVAAGDRVLFVGPPAPSAGRNNRMRRNGQSGDNAELVCRSAGTGQPVWSTAAGPLAAWAFVGPPLVSGDDLYAVAIDNGTGGNNGGNNGTGTYTLVRLGLADGAVRSRVPLGTPQFPVDPYRGQPMTRPPALLERAGEVFVLTNDGAVLAVHPGSGGGTGGAADAGRVDWAFTYPPKAESQDNQYFNYAVPPPPLAPGAMAAAGGTLFVKEFGTSALYALDPDGPAVKWHRPVDDASGLAGVNGTDVVLVGPSVDAIDVATRRMRWSEPVSVATGDVQAAWAGGHLYAFGRRGIHDVVLGDGDDGGPVFRGADRDAGGGVVLRSGDRLITVSSAFVTAYPLGTPLAPTPGGH